MEEYQELCITTEYSVMDAIKVLDQTHERIVMILDGGKLVGILTDSDVRRAILDNKDLSQSVINAMNPNPCIVFEDEGMDARHEAEKLMELRNLDAVPIVDIQGRLCGLEVRHGNLEHKTKRSEAISAPVVIMAGGKGTRLAPYTNVLPKPLIPIGEKTILEHVIESFERSGCRDYHISVNYKKNLIKAFFQDAEYNRNISFVEEDKFLGTAGSLYLLKGKIKDTFFVSNCDILLDVDYSHVYKFHKDNQNVITMITSLKDYTIPYGIVELSDDSEMDGRVSGLKEKPSLNFLINTGVYVLEPEVLEMIPENEFFHITDLIEQCITAGKKVGAYPITEKSWEDMGELAGMENMILARKER